MADHFRIREFVRWSDVDKAGIIHWGAYVRFFEMAETEMFRAVGLPYSRVFEQFDFPADETDELNDETFGDVGPLSANAGISSGLTHMPR